MFFYKPMACTTMTMGPQLSCGMGDRAACAGRSLAMPCRGRCLFLIIFGGGVDGMDFFSNFVTCKSAYPLGWRLKFDPTVINYIYLLH